MRLNLLRLIPGLLGFLIVIAILASLVREPIMALSTSFISNFGLLGVFVSVILLDVIPFIGDSPALVIAWAGGMHFAAILAVASAGAVVGGVVDWSLGRLLGHLPIVQRTLDRFYIGPFLRKYGAKAVAVSAFVPSPYSLVALGAGAARVPLYQVVLGALFRAPRLAIYLGLIALGWSVGG